MAPAQQAPLKTVLSHVIVPVIMGLIMALAYLGGFHKPQPHHVPVAVVGPAQTAGPVAAQVQEGLGDKADVTTAATQAEATDKLMNQEIAAAFVPGKGSAELITAGGGSDSTKTTVEKMFRAVADKQHVDLEVSDAAPLDENDPIGQNGFFYLVAMTVGAYATSIAIAAAGATRRFTDRIALLLGGAVVISTLMILLSRFGFGMFEGHALAVWGLSLLYTAGVLSVGVGLHPVVGRFATLTYSAIFVALNFTSSGGVFTPVLQPAFFGWLHDFWIGSGFVEAQRRITYFPDQSLGGPIGILVGWLVLGALCLVIGFTTERRRSAALTRKTQNEAVGKHSAGAHLERRPEYDFDEATEEELEENVAV